MYEAPKSLPVLAAEPTDIIDAVIGNDRRILFLGQPGIGKSTLVNAMADALGRAGRTCWCIGADPGSPLFGIPGAACLGRWDGEGWELMGVEALCTLDAGRFRLPLVSAVARLAQDLPPGVVLVDGPGVVRGIAGAELLPGIVEAAAIDAVLALTREGRPVPLTKELLALPVEAFAVQASAEARRPGKRLRARGRTMLWEAYLSDATEQRLALEQLQIIGTPPPLDVPSAWLGRQIALLDGQCTVAMGEVTAAEEGALRVKLTAPLRRASALLVRDAVRLTDGRLGTATRFTTDRLDYLPPPDMAPRLDNRNCGWASRGGPRRNTQRESCKRGVRRSPSTRAPAPPEAQPAVRSRRGRTSVGAGRAPGLRCVHHAHPYGSYSRLSVAAAIPHW